MKTEFKNLDGNKTIQELLIEKEIYIYAPCGGHGTCGKCKVKMNGQTVLACNTKPVGDIIVEYEDNSENETYVHINPSKNKRETSETLTMVVDLGTTTIASALIDETGCILATATGVNHQRALGSDVLSRISAQMNGKGDWLTNTVRHDIAKLAEKMECSDVPIVVAGNTTMQHLFMGYDCKGLGTAPYQPVDISLNRTTIPLTEGIDKKVIMVPGISAFIGADIACGICALDMDIREDISMMIDLGTNGEIAVGNKDRMLCASTAAGPAFEGGNMSCGMPGVPGAICDVMIRPEGGAAKAEIIAEITAGEMTDFIENEGYLIAYKTVADAEPKGICGSGIVAAISELISNEIVDETGCMDEDFEDDGFKIAEASDGTEIIVTQEDVREMQMAKGNVRAGFDTITDTFGVDYEQISNLYLAGSFGQNMSIEKAANIGIIPPELADKAMSVGNTSALGAIMFATELSEREHNSDIEKRLIRISQYAEAIELATQKNFNEFFMQGIMFE